MFVKKRKQRKDTFMHNYRIMGEGPVKFVIEMGLGSCIGEWMPFARKLEEHGGVLLYERAGIGKSEKSDDGRIPRVIAEELHDLLEDIEHEEKYVLIAHSQGGLYANQYVRLFSEEIEKLVLVDPLSANDNKFKNTLSEEEYTKSGVDKSNNLLILEKLSKWHLGWLAKKMMRNAPPVYYYADFEEEDLKSILDSYANITHLSTAYEEYIEAHREYISEELANPDTFPNIPLVLIVHDSEVAIKESMEFGNNSKEFATKIENMWQEIMSEYLDFSTKSLFIVSEGSSHYIHLTDPASIINAVI